MDIPGSIPVNPAAETAMAAQARKVAGPREHAALKQTQQALDPARKGRRSSRSAERREDGRGLNLDIRA
jgi:hypothetical protein